MLFTNCELFFFFCILCALLHFIILREIRKKRQLKSVHQSHSLFRSIPFVRRSKNASPSKWMLSMSFRCCVTSTYEPGSLLSLSIYRGRRGSGEFGKWVVRSAFVSRKLDISMSSDAAAI